VGDRPKLPTDLAGCDVRSALERLGFAFKRQKGSHMVMARQDPPCRVVVPDHKNVRVGTLRKIISQAGLAGNHHSPYCIRPYTTPGRLAHADHLDFQRNFYSHVLF
jgi:predicted RNA binding protein YcfA (HicA-like mRNA interferase family)